ncbi:choline ABC transporter ATP-binding protein [Prosthecomicrobium pneumaticum]|uniref:Glycine betaine/proline transport system ATP-binding protein n=1 Tax=Prosthecomicrobium pneumaticum TaxID=81895 RepID=A0A7W9FKQ4_9HYPH|nr:glycine betaine/proline transport system ATP-binding protein [Prosthecomicrobium pneumaticum]
MAAIAFRSVDVLLGRGRSISPKWKGRALAMLDRGASREDVFAATGLMLAASGATLDVEAGEICVLMGLSGSGKSTLLRAVNGLAPIARGRLEIAHEGRTVDLGGCEPGLLRTLRTRRIAMVFQQFALLPWRTVRQNVGFGLELAGVPKAERDAKVAQMLDLVALDKWADRYAAELSGGMQQRVGLARALATDADILLMDEPFSALDPLIRDRLQDEMLALQKSLKKTILFVSHDLDEAMKLGSRIAIMEAGRIVQSGSVEDILARPANDYVAAFVQHVNPLDVLRGGAIMTPLAETPRIGPAVLLDPEGRLRLSLDAEGRPAAATENGRDATLGGPDAEADIVVAPLDLTLRAAIALRGERLRPIALVDAEGRLAGVIGGREIVRALTRRDQI